MTTPTSSSATSSALRILLVVSLTLNVFVVSAATTTWLRHGQLCFRSGHALRDWRPTRMPSPRELQRTLPEADQQALKDALSIHRQMIREHMHELRDARQAVSDVLRAEPFDKARLDAAFAAVRERETELSKAAQAMMSDLAAQVSAEGRGKMADQLQAGKGQRGNKMKCKDCAPGDVPGDVARPADGRAETSQPSQQ